VRGRFISLEGGEGAGKSTVLTTSRDFLKAADIDAVPTREPGGTPFGEALRAVLLDPQFRGVCVESELLTMFAVRAQLVREVVEPALAASRWLLSDRFTDASFAYQGGGRDQSQERIADLEKWAACGLRPDIALLPDLPVDQGLARVPQRAMAGRIEMEHASFFEQVRNGYRQRAADDPRRFRIIDASQAVERVIDHARSAVNRFIVDSALRTIR
jgi:dTMP kinase